MLNSAGPVTEERMVVHLNLVTAVMAVVDLRAFENKDAVADHAVVEVQRTFGLENKML